MDFLVHCILFLHLFDIFQSTTTSNANTDSSQRHREKWLQRYQVGPILKTTENCKFSFKMKAPTKLSEQSFEVASSDQMDALVERNAASINTLYLPHRLHSFTHIGIPACPTQIVIDKSAIYRLEKLVLKNLPQLPANIERLHSLKQFEGTRIYSAFVDFTVLTNMKQLESISLTENIAVTIFLSMQLPSLQHLVIRDSPMMFFNTVFCDFPNLISLELQNNSLKVIPSYFSTFTKLKRIQIMRNKLQHIVMDIFSNMSQLENLNIKFNQIFKITTQSRVVLPRLKTLNLESNNLTVLNATLWKTPSLDLIILTSNQLKQIFGLQELLSARVQFVLLNYNLLDCKLLKRALENITHMQADGSCDTIVRKLKN